MILLRKGTMKKISLPKDALSEATKESLRLFVMGLFSYIVTNALDFSITYFTDTKPDDVSSQIVFACILYSLRFLDKYWHEQQKQTGEKNIFTFVSKQLQFKNISL